jgi:hypothetical protein
LFVDARSVADYERGHQAVGLYTVNLIDSIIASGSPSLTELNIPAKHRLHRDLHADES